jgi:hypothetical protein
MPTVFIQPNVFLSHFFLRVAYSRALLFPLIYLFWNSLGGTLETSQDVLLVAHDSIQEVPKRNFKLLRLRQHLQYICHLS